MSISIDSNMRIGLCKAGDVATAIVDNMKNKTILANMGSTCRDSFERVAEQMTPEEYLKGLQYIRQVEKENNMRESIDLLF